MGGPAALLKEYLFERQISYGYGHLVIYEFKTQIPVTDAITGAEIPDARIKLEESWYEAGIYAFEQMVPGTYNYLVSRAGYFDKVGSAVIITDHLNEAIELDVDDTGLLAPGLNRLKVYPNPASDEIWIDLNLSHSEKISLRIYNLQGQVVYQKLLEQQGEKTMHVNIGNLKPGVYLLVFICKDDRHLERLFIR